MLADSRTAHGLEQQLIDALLECLANGSPIEVARAIVVQRDIATRFEALLQAHPGRDLRIAEICQLLGVSASVLRAACGEQLGMEPLAYVRCHQTATGASHAKATDAS